MFQGTELAAAAFALDRTSQWSRRLQHYSLPRARHQGRRNMRTHARLRQASRGLPRRASKWRDPGGRSRPAEERGSERGLHEHSKTPRDAHAPCRDHCRVRYEGA
eukprot:6198049-Pleurochrysis_carterae.AAC.1